VPVQLLLEVSSRPYAMFKDYWKYEWVLPVRELVPYWSARQAYAAAAGEASTISCWTTNMIAPTSAP
jgi:hypothetical protein